MKLKNESKKLSGSENRQNQLNESREIFKQSLILWKTFLSSLNDSRNLARIGRHARGHILRLLELNSARVVK